MASTASGAGCWTRPDSSTVRAAASSAACSRCRRFSPATTSSATHPVSWVAGRRPSSASVEGEGQPARPPGRVGQLLGLPRAPRATDPQHLPRRRPRDGHLDLGHGDRRGRSGRAHPPGARLGSARRQDTDGGDRHVVTLRDVPGREKSRRAICGRPGRTDNTRAPAVDTATARRGLDAVTRSGSAWSPSPDCHATAHLVRRGRTAEGDDRGGRCASSRRRAVRR